MHPEIERWIIRLKNELMIDMIGLEDRVVHNALKLITEDSSLHSNQTKDTNEVLLL